jgi:hypothetical protein
MSLAAAALGDVMGGVLFGGVEGCGVFAFGAKNKAPLFAVVSLGADAGEFCPEVGSFPTFLTLPDLCFHH